MPRLLSVAVALAVMLSAALFVAWLVVRGHPSAPPSAITISGTTGSSSAPAVPPAQIRYLDDKLGFSFGLPEGYTAAVAPSTNIQDAEAVIAGDEEGEKLIVIAEPAGGSAASFSATDAVHIEPALSITESSAVEIAPGVTGVAFRAQNDPQWSGAESANLWFIYKGMLYRLSTPIADANFLTFVWNSWRW